MTSALVVGIVGAVTMGAGIAQLALTAIVRSEGLQTTAQVVDYFLMRFLRVPLAPDDRQRGDGVNTTAKEAGPETRKARAQGGPLAAVPARDIHGGHTAGIGEAAAGKEICPVLE